MLWKIWICTSGLSAKGNPHLTNSFNFVHTGIMVESADGQPRATKCLVMTGGGGSRTDWVNGHGRERWERITETGLRITALVRPLQGSERFEMLGVNEEVEGIVLDWRLTDLSSVDRVLGEGFSNSLVRDAGTRLVAARFAGPGQADGHGNVADICRTTVYRPVIGPS